MAEFAFIRRITAQIWMILGFKTRATERLFMGEQFGKARRRYADTALRKLDMLDRAHRLEDVKTAPASKLKRLVGDRRGQHSIHLNSRWRICFVWTKEGPVDVEIVDYHSPKGHGLRRDNTDQKETRGRSRGGRTRRGMQAGH